MSHWKIETNGFEESETSYSAGFALTNVDTGKQVLLRLSQNKGDPASDLIGACRALAELLIRSARGPDDEDRGTVKKLN